MGKKSNIVLVDDHKIFRYALKLFIETNKGLSIIDEACNGKEAVEKALMYNPDIIIMDIYMPILDGLEAAKELREKGIRSKIIILTGSKKKEHIIAASKSGVKGYILKDSEPENLLRAINEVARGRSYIDPEAALLLSTKKGMEMDVYRENMGKIELLSKREYEVLELLAKGLSNKAIGDELFISEKTVKNHVTSILKKLEVKDRVQATIFTYDNIKIRIDT